MSSSEEEVFNTPTEINKAAEEISLNLLSQKCYIKECIRHPGISIVVEKLYYATRPEYSFPIRMPYSKSRLWEMSNILCSSHNVLFQ